MTSRRTRWIRLLALSVTGGTVFQIAGCLSGVVPVGLSFAESAVLAVLFSRLLTS